MCNLPSVCATCPVSFILFLLLLLFCVGVTKLRNWIFDPPSQRNCVTTLATNVDQWNQMNQARFIHRQLPPLHFPSKVHPFLSSFLFGVNISLTAIISTATASGTSADNSPGACILRIRLAVSRLLEINPGELLFL